MFLVVRFLQRERRRELDRWQSAVAAEHRERELLESRVKQQEAERASEELGRQVLEQQLGAAQLESRAAEAEKSALQLKSELYASIGIMSLRWRAVRSGSPLMPCDSNTRSTVLSRPYSHG